MQGLEANVNRLISFCTDILSMLMPSVFLVVLVVLNVLGLSVFRNLISTKFDVVYRRVFTIKDN